MNFSIERITVVAKSRQLTATYSIETPQSTLSDGFDWDAFHRMSARERRLKLGHDGEQSFDY